MQHQQHPYYEEQYEYDGEWTTVKGSKTQVNEVGKKKKKKPEVAAVAKAASTVRLNILGKPAQIKLNNAFQEAEDVREKKLQRQAESERIAQEEKQKRLEEAQKAKAKAKVRAKEKENGPVGFKKLSAAEKVGVELLPERVRMKVISIESKYPNNVGLQLAGVAEFLEEGFEEVADFQWNKKLTEALAAGNGEHFPRSLLRIETCRIIGEWLAGKDVGVIRDTLKTELLPLTFPECSFYSAKPLASQGIGLKIFVQLAMQYVEGLFDPKNPFFTLEKQEKNASAMQQASYFIVQLAKKSPSAGLQAWFHAILPICATVGASAALVEPLKSLLQRNRSNIINFGDLTRVLRVGFANNEPDNEAKQAIRNLWPLIANASVVGGVTKINCSSEIMAQFLEIISSTSSNNVLHGHLLDLFTRLVSKDQNGFDEWLKHHKKHPVGTAQIWIHLSNNISNLRKSLNIHKMQHTLSQMEKDWAEPPSKSNKVAFAPGLLEARTAACLNLHKKHSSGFCSALVKISLFVGVVGGGYALFLSNFVDSPLINLVK